MRKLLFLITLCLFTGEVYAQYKSVNFGLGTSAFRSETSNDALFPLEELGRSAYFQYNHWLKDSRWQLTAIASYHRIRGRIQVRDFLVQNTLYQAKSEHFNLGGGIKFYLDNDLSRFRPREGQCALFGAAFAGIETFIHNLEADRLGANPQQKREPGFKVSPFVSGEGGIRVYLDHEWFIELSAGAKYGFHDYWDGISGHTGVNDFIIFAHLSLGYTF